MSDLVLMAPVSPREALASSRSVDWYTPRDIADGAREVMGWIDLDPASCVEANLTIQARRFYTIEDDGMRQDWTCASMWLNGPYGREEDHKSSQARWSARLVYEYQRGVVGQACMLVNAMTGNRWFQPLWQFPMCFVDGRIHFVAPRDQPAKDQPTHSSVVVYMGPEDERFSEAFSRFGTVVLPRQIVRQVAQPDLFGGA